jgi:hypothetical protein
VDSTLSQMLEYEMRSRFKQRHFHLNLLLIESVPGPDKPRVGSAPAVNLGFEAMAPKLPQSIIISVGSTKVLAWPGN